ncbi:hypothetical protein [Prescottella sp. R16]|nr:hypothetical protein [Prescottella sp. R16]
MDFGSVTDAIAIPVGSADTVVTGFVNSITQVVVGVSALAQDLLGNFGS